MQKNILTNTKFGIDGDAKYAYGKKYWVLTNIIIYVVLKYIIFYLKLENKMI